MIASAILASMAMTRIWQLIVLWGVVVGFGTGMVALVLGATVATRWFAERRGLVVGMLTASTATGQLVFLPLLAKLTQDHGWRSALAFVVVMLLVAGAVALLALRDRPFDVGLAPYGGRAIEPPPKRICGFLRHAGVALARARGGALEPDVLGPVRDFLVCGLSTNGLIQTHWIALCGDYGVAPVSAAGALAVIGDSTSSAHLASGWLSDRYDNRWLLFVYYGLRGLSLIALPFTDSLVGLSAFAVFYGLDWVATVPPTVRLTAERFGAERSNVTFGWIFAAHQLGAATAAFGGRRPHRAIDLSSRALCRGDRMRDRRRARAHAGPPRPAARSRRIDGSLSSSARRRRRRRPGCGRRVFSLRRRSGPAGARDRTGASLGS